MVRDKECVLSETGEFTRLNVADTDRAVGTEGEKATSGGMSKGMAMVGFKIQEFKSWE